MPSQRTSRPAPINCGRWDSSRSSSRRSTADPVPRTSRARRRHEPAQLRDALADPGIAAVIATRGGYGSAHLLPFLDWAEIRAARTLLIGYSDITALLDAFAGLAGLVSVHGPMAEGRLARGVGAFDPDSFLRIVSEPVPFGSVAAPQAHTLQPGEASGVLRGGTLTQLAAAVGHAMGTRGRRADDPVSRRGERASLPRGSTAVAVARCRRVRHGHRRGTERIARVRRTRRECHRARCGAPRARRLSRDPSWLACRVGTPPA